MQSLTVKWSGTQLGTQAQAADWQVNEQPLPRVRGRKVEIGEYSVLSQRAPEDEKHASNKVEYDDDNRHWSPNSQPYAPADILFRYLRGGWLLGDTVIIQVTRCFSRRCVEVYYFRLTYDGESVLMPTIANPVILRLIMERGLTMT